MSVGRKKKENVWLARYCMHIARHSTTSLLMHTSILPACHLVFVRQHMRSRRDCTSVTIVLHPLSYIALKSARLNHNLTIGQITAGRALLLRGTWYILPIDCGMSLFQVETVAGGAPTATVW